MVVRLGVAAIVLCSIAVSCGSDSEPSGASEVPDRIVGLITEVEPEDESEVPTSFKVEEDDGDTFTIEIDPQLDYGFDLLHVREHFVTEDPVDVSVEERDDALVATSIEDVE